MKAVATTIVGSIALGGVLTGCGGGTTTAAGKTTTKKTLELEVAASCSGSADPAVTAAQCYHGSAGALGLKENVDVTIRDFASSAGHLDVKGDGIQTITCSNEAFTKSGQEITSDLSDCLPSTVTISDIKYCSDQDSVHVTVKDTTVPLPITATLTRVTCGSAQESAMDAMWREFSEEHGENGDDRRPVFEENVQYIISENQKVEDYWLGVNQFAAMTREEFKSTMLGYKKPAEESAKLGVHTYSGAPVPDSVDWSSKGAVTPIKNQGQCGSCWAFSTTGSLEGRAQIAKGNLVSFSEQQFVDCDKAQDQGCNGGLMDNAFVYAQSADICTEASYPYTGKGGTCAASSCSAGLKKGEITGHVDVDASEEALAEAVAQGPVSVAVDAETIFQFYSGGVMSGLCGATLDHGVLVVGYGEDSGKKYWKVKNSWGSSWGESGYVRMAKGKGGKGQCGILTGPPSYPQIASSDSVTI